jgi:hydroxyacylglutathione hydrolase
MHVETLAVGPLACNCSLLADLDARQALVIDPGGDAELLLGRVAALGVTVTALAHTHAHLDHVGATAELQRRLGAPALLHAADRFLYDLLPVQAALVGLAVPEPAELGAPLEAGMRLPVGALVVRVVHTPGHSPGGVCFVVEHAGTTTVFAGDTLFHRGVGRTDLWGGDEATLLRSIRDELLVLPDATRVVCGHGPDTTIGAERRGNPFLR